MAAASWTDGRERSIDRSGASELVENETPGAAQGGLSAPSKAATAADIPTEETSCLRGWCPEIPESGCPAPATNNGGTGSLNLPSLAERATIQSLPVPSPPTMVARNHALFISQSFRQLSGSSGNRIERGSDAASGFFEPSSPVADTPPIDLDLACARIRDGLIGRNDPLDTPFGIKPLVYVDWTTNGRLMEPIEKFMRHEVYPRYGSTHTTSSVTGAQTTAFREEARRIIAEAVNAKDEGKGDGDVVILAGSSSTDAVTKILPALFLDKKPRRFWRPADTPVVFVGPFEGPASILRWRENDFDVVTIAESTAGGLDLQHLELQLKKFSKRRLKIGSFAAASDVTGAMEDTAKVTRILKRQGALSFWDYASVAPHVEINMNPDGSSESDRALVAKDAIFIAGHKCLGGAGTPGLMICKKTLFRGDVAVAQGGNMGFSASSTPNAYLSDIKEREEGGTSEVLGTIRLGLAFQMKKALGNVESRQNEMTEMGLAALRSNPRLILLGDTGRSRLPIFSFLVRHGDRYLHHNFVCALLNDLFGVQARAGCVLSDRHGFVLLGLGNVMTPKILHHQLKATRNIIRPGFCQFSLAFFASQAEARYILNAVLFVANHGAWFLPLYHANVSTGEWASTVCPSSTHNNAATRLRLTEVDYGFSETPVDMPLREKISTTEPPVTGGEAAMFAKLMAEALELASILRSTYTSELAGRASAPSIAPKGRVRTANFNNTITEQAGPVRKQSTARVVTPDNLELTRRFASLGLRFGAPGTAVSTLNEEVESMRWFYFPAEDTASIEPTSFSSLGDGSAPSMIMPKLCDWRRTGHGSQNNEAGSEVAVESRKGKQRTWRLAFGWNHAH